MRRMAWGQAVVARVRPEVRVLLSSAGRRVQLIECFRADAVRLGVGLEIIAVDSEPALSVACRVADHAYGVPPCTDPTFVVRLLEICSRHRVDLLVPTIDPELEILSQSAPAFVQVGTRVAVSASGVVALARDKLHTAQHLAFHGLPVPWTIEASRLGAHPPQPFRRMILKPRHGSSSVGIRRIERVEDWPLVLSGGCPPEDCILQDLLAGDEYTVNLFFDAEGRLRSAVPHHRIAVRDGEVAKGITRRHSKLLALAEALGAVLQGARGPLCFQAIVSSSGAAAIFEINARFGGGFPLAHHAGARFTQWLLEEALGLPSSANDDWRDGVLMLRYDAAVFTEGLQTRNASGIGKTSHV